MNKFWVIVGDVYKKNVRSISFLIMLLVPFILGGIIYVASYFGGQSNEVDTIGITADSAELAEGINAAAPEDYDFKLVDSRDAGERELSAEQIDGLLFVESGENHQLNATLYSESSLGQSTELTLQQILSSIQTNLRAEELGLSSNEVQSLNQTATFNQQRVSFNDANEMELGDDNEGFNFVISFAATIVLFVFIITYAGIISQEIASEKGTRIMEVILSSTRAQVHFYGKLVGILLVAFTQMLVYVAAFAISYQWLKGIDVVENVLDSVSIQGVFGTFLIFTSLFLVLGIFIYAVLAALCGSLVTKTEDTSKVILPVTYLSLIGYLLGISLGSFDPGNLIIRITSYIPFLSSYLMPIRLANETASIQEAVISLVILLGTTFLLTVISAKMYKSNVLVYNDKGVVATLKQSFTLMKS
ncbi:ABC transporter permease [Tetragenococcus muriaticus]|uniref:Permease component of an ABC superfamily transporter n=2 Tax=Tetragenococcus muriaticus TaxID=64642 RepID=A0A091CCH0_9ENTE|nr:ABC transporter permease [Tetragenococcus muriaticus]KFN90318.1 permease component of an ABC superfamily transporter [Tetragenococcus muriaticus 3MR10-3]GMA46760.1 sodium ABC transporter permease [Tetragenococcus muriaticus]